MASKPKKSGVWNFFEKVSDVECQCNLCSAKISHKGGGTSSMLKHLKGKHNMTDLNKSQQPTTRMGTITSFIRRPMSTEKQQEITKKALMMCVTDLRPLSIVEGKGFRQFCDALNPSYRCPSHTTMHNYLQLLYKEQKQVLIERLSKLDSLALTTDAWTSCATQSYVTVTGHYLDEQWNLKSVMIATRQVEERHTGVNMAALQISISTLQRTY